jgi:hypothetical protein
MRKKSILSIAVGVGNMLLTGEGREVLGLGHLDRHLVAIGQAPKPVAGMPEHAGEREAAGQDIRMARAIQIATPSAGIFYGSQEGPSR